MRTGSMMLGAALLASTTSAPAAEIFVGLLAHDVDTRLTKSGLEDGADVQLGWRAAPIAGLAAIGAPSPYVFGSVATGGETHFAAAGLSWKVGGRLFLRPGVGIAIHDRDDFIVGPDGRRADFGSRILFAPELGIGYQATPRLAVEATWVHLSHGRLFSAQNPGMDSIGIRLSYGLR